MQTDKATNELEIEDLAFQEFTIEALEERFEMQAMRGAGTDCIGSSLIICTDTGEEF